MSGESNCYVCACVCHITIHLSVERLLGCCPCTSTIYANGRPPELLDINMRIENILDKFLDWQNRLQKVEHVLQHLLVNNHIIYLNPKEEIPMAEEKKKWIAGAVKHKGALHRALKVPEGKKIPAKKIAKAAHSKSPKVRKEVALARTLSKLRKK